MAGPSVHCLLAPEVVLGHGVDQAHGAVVDRGEDLVPVGDQLRSHRGSEMLRGSSRRLDRKRPALGGPSLQPAIENRGSVEPDPAEHPPDSRCPRRHEAVVQDDAGIVADSQRTHGGAELLRSRHGKLDRAVAVGEITHEIREARARDVSGFVFGASVHVYDAPGVVRQ